MEPLPKFVYHPDPIATGAVISSEEVCECCEKPRGFVYDSVIYAEDEILHVCPWCISSGAVAEKFDADFVDSHPLAQAGIADAIIEEVSLRTPGYTSWQQESWLSCCSDACEFHGDATKEELAALDAEGLKRLSDTTGFPVEHLPDILKFYEPKGSPAFYRFVCRHCSIVRYHGDCH